MSAVQVRAESVVTDQEWRKSALCAQIGPELFFTDPGDSQQRMARRVCRACPVMAECLAEALRLEWNECESHGVYGGLSAPARRRIINSRKAGRGAAGGDEVNSRKRVSA